MHSQSTNNLNVASDFDNTMVVHNTALAIINDYLWHGNAPLLQRIWNVTKLGTRQLRSKNLSIYYDILRSQPPAQQRAQLLHADINPTWLSRMQELRFEHHTNNIKLTIISRNCADVVSSWVHIHELELARYHITIEHIIANKPLDDQKSEFVLGDLHHFHHAGNGQLHLQGKAQFLNHFSIYLGDAGEEILRTSVKEFIRI